MVGIIIKKIFSGV